MGGYDRIFTPGMVRIAMTVNILAYVRAVYAYIPLAFNPSIEGGNAGVVQLITGICS